MYLISTRQVEKNKPSLLSSTQESTHERKFLAENFSDKVNAVFCKVKYFTYWLVFLTISATNLENVKIFFVTVKTFVFFLEQDLLLP